MVYDTESPHVPHEVLAALRINDITANTPVALRYACTSMDDAGTVALSCKSAIVITSRCPVIYRGREWYGVYAN